MANAEGFHGAEVLREGDHIRGVMAVIQLWESPDAAKTFNAANKRANPTLTDLPGPTPVDQGGILFGGGHNHGDHGHGHGHDHGDRGLGTQALTTGLDFKRGGGLFARLLHGHFEVVAQAQS